MSNKERHIFLHGICGMGMAPLAVYLQQNNWIVYGYDDHPDYEIVSMLNRQGINILNEAKIPDLCIEFVYSSAVSASHPLYQEAVNKKLKLSRRGHFLAHVLKGKKVIAIMGSHGKTTTTAMLAHMLSVTKNNIGYIVGGFFRDNYLLPARSTNSDWIVVEVDESDGTISQFSPEITVALNVDWDHITQYQKEEDVWGMYKSLFERTRSNILLDASCVQLKDIAGDPGKVVEFGHEQQILRETDSGQFCVVNRGVSVGPVKGRFNAENLSAALSLLDLLNIPYTSSVMEGFRGVARRQDVLLDTDKLKILADYAHHPTEIKAYIDYVKASNNGPLSVVFQPHRYTRTKHYLNEFAKVFQSADRLALLPVYAASELFDEEGTSDRLLTAIQSNNPGFDVQLCEDISSLNWKQSGCVLFIGAGSIGTQAKSLAWDMKEKLFQGASDFEELIKEMGLKSKYKKNEPLKNKTTLRVGGNATHYVEPVDVDELRFFLRFAKKKTIPVFVLGRGSNLIVSDKGFDGLVVRLSCDYWKATEYLCGTTFKVRGGVRLKELCAKACNLGIAGFEFLEGIPGTIGGALRMNAGAMKGEMFDLVKKVKFITYDGEIKELEKKDFDVGYRRCWTLKDTIVVEAALQGTENASDASIRETLSSYGKWRKSVQPKESSAGCIFKNPEGMSAGQLVDSLGLKNLSVGNATVSNVHANFIINKNGEATSADVLNLVKKVRETARQERGIELEPEVLLLGESWENIL